MHLVEPRVDSRDASYPHGMFSGVPLMVTFADGDDLRALSEAKQGPLPVRPESSVGDDDCYLVIPDDIGDEIVDILRDGDHDLLDDALAEGMLVCGDLAIERGAATLIAEHAVSPAAALATGMPYAASVRLHGHECVVSQINGLSHVQCTMMSALMDEHGLDSVVRNKRYVGVAWRPPTPALAALSPTYVLSRHTAAGQVGIELALFVEDDELIALLRPARLLLA